MRGLHHREEQGQREGLEMEQDDNSENERDGRKPERGSMMREMCEAEERGKEGGSRVTFPWPAVGQQYFDNCLLFASAPYWASGNVKAAATGQKFFLPFFLLGFQSCVGALVL